MANNHCSHARQNTQMHALYKLTKDVYIYRLWHKRTNKHTAARLMTHLPSLPLPRRPR